MFLKLKLLPVLLQVILYIGQGGLVTLQTRYLKPSPHCTGFTQYETENET